MTRKNQLFLSKIVQLNNQSSASCVFDWFQNNLKCAGVHGWRDGESMADDIVLKKEGKEELLEFLNRFDLSVDDIVVREEAAPADVIAQLPMKLQGEVKALSFLFFRKTQQGEFPLDLREESEGTRKLYSLAAPFLLALKSGATLVIDELNNSLHPLILREIIEIFHDENINKNNAQLIFTTFYHPRWSYFRPRSFPLRPNLLLL
ncbi:MAG: AAA family ATPase [Wolinella sp.]